MIMDRLKSSLLPLDTVRYLAVLENGKLSTQAKEGRTDASSSESDRYEELIVNPTLVKLVGQRGDIDCGGLQYVVIRYGHFFQVVVPTPSGHVSICVEPTGDPHSVAQLATEALDESR